jgi:hypothetical protein
MRPGGEVRYAQVMYLDGLLGTSSLSRRFDQNLVVVMSVLDAVLAEH